MEGGLERRIFVYAKMRLFFAQTIKTSAYGSYWRCFGMYANHAA